MSPRAVRIVFAVGLAAWLVNAAIQLWTSPPLGHDEARYALSAQHWLAGEPPRWFYAPVGMRYLALPGVLAGGGELALRIAPAILALGFVLAAAALARIVAGAACAAWTCVVLAASASFGKRATELLSDLPATGCLLAGIAILAAELVRDGGPRWRLVLAAPCFAAAFYLRYGSVVPIAVIAGAAILVGGRAIVRRPLPVLGAIALFAALLVPHVLLARELTGSALGILNDRHDVSDAPPGESLLVYLTANPFTYYGIATAVALVAGLAAIHRWRDRHVRLLWLIGVGDIVALGLLPIAQVRYIFPGIALLCILGVAAILRWTAAARPPVRRAVAACACAIAAASWIVVAVTSWRQDESRRAIMRGTLVAVAAIRDDARGAPCLAVGRRTTQLEWYSGCRTEYWTDVDQIAQLRVYLVYEPDSGRQPDVAAQPGTPRVIAERDGVIVMRLEPGR